MARISSKYDESSCLSKWLMIWTYWLVKLFTRMSPEVENLPEVPSSLHFSSQFKQLRQYWKEELEKPSPSFFKALFKTIKYEYLKAVLLASYFQLITLLQAVVIGLLVEWLKDESDDVYIGYLLLLVFIFITLSSYLSLNRGLMMLMVIISKSKCFVCLLLSKKVSKISYGTLMAKNNAGKVLNIIGSDIELFELLSISVLIWGSPLVIIASVIVLWFYIGYVSIIAILISLLHMGILVLLGKISMKLRLKVASITDARVKIITNLIENIKLVKLYAWEFTFISNVLSERSREIATQIKLIIVSIVQRVIYTGLMPIGIFIPILIYIYSYGDLSVDDSVPVYSILYSLNAITMYSLTIGIRNVFVFLATCKRITETLMMKEVDITYDKSDPFIYLERASFSWNEINNTSDDKEPLLNSETALTNISVSVEPGEILIVTGPIGSGKSSFLVSLLKEIHLVSGDMKSSGSFAYASDSPWVISDTVKENIIMGQTMNEELYTNAIESSQLVKDIQEMEHGELTLVGDRGITLSGGQKARLGLARVFYSDADILLLDDPISAVDTEVSSAIFSSIKQKAREGKIVVLVTHQIHTLPHADKILILNNGQQMFYGNYSDMKNREDINSVLGQIHKKEERIEEKEDGDAIIQQEKLMKTSEKYENIEISFSLYRFYLKLGYKNLLILIISITLLTISQVVFLSIPYWVIKWTSSSDQTDLFYVVGSLLIIALSYVFGFCRYLVLFLILIIANKHLHNKSLEGLTKTRAVFFDKNPTGRILNRFTKDTAVIDENLLHYFSEAVNMFFVIFGSIIVVIILSPGSLVGMILYGFLAYFVIKKMLPVSKALRMIEITSRGPLLTSVHSVLDGILSIRCMDLSKKFYLNAERSVMDNLRAMIYYYTTLRCMQFTIEIGSLAVAIANAIFIVAMKGEISSELAAVSLVVSLSINGLSSHWAKTLVETDNYMASPARLHQYVSLPSEGEYQTEVPFEISRGEIKFDRVNLKYQDHLPLSLKNLSFSVNSACKVGIIGRTGSGKSSIIQALFRLTPICEGSICIDGQDISSVGLHQLRCQMSVIPQTSLLFRGTLRQNLDPFSNCNDEFLVKVLKEVQLEDLVGNLDKNISFEDFSLSAGQKQLVCLARAISSNAKIVVMDEATANVDHKTDKLIQKMLRRSFKNSTLLVIAHRLRTIVKSDLIIVMENGTCTEIGSPQSLASDQSSAFYNFVMCSGESDILFQKIHHKN